ncbi:hypothetical protein AB0O34_36665 [Sphaerisporangium sp. NPDC088356]|uniref:hypothetical protein n=1 Tax=Sphaerisporangium sp. NPDC088356 TaxID=3154871 RepID=UPI00341CE670
MAGLTHHDRRPDWEYLTQCEYRLKDLEKIVDWAVKYLPDTEAHWCANRFMGHIKAIMDPFIGMSRGYPVDEAVNPTDELRIVPLSEFLEEDDDQYMRPATTVYESLLRSSEAYDAVYTHLYAKLPHCRGCSCL